MKLFGRKNSKNEFTRMCIAEAIISLLEKQPLSSIRVSSVVVKAGVSRMTFYNNYSSIPEALRDYLKILIRLYLEESRKDPSVGPFLSYSHILFSIQFFGEYRKYFHVMADNGLHNIMIEAVNRVLSEEINDSPYSAYELCIYGGGLFNAFLKWIDDKEGKTPEELAALIYSMFNPDSSGT